MRPAAFFKFISNPVAGTWQVQVVLNLTVSGEEFTQTVYRDVTDP